MEDVGADAEADIEALCERAPGDAEALRAVGALLWAGTAHSCGSGVALSPLWGRVETETERRLARQLLARAAGGEAECRALAGLIRGQAVRAAIAGGDEDAELQSALVEVLEGADRHALFALFILAVLVIDEPLGAELFSRANVIQTFHWTVSIVTTECTGDPAAAQCCLELLQLLATRTDLVDAIEQHETVAEQIAQLVRALPAAGVGCGALKMLFTLATASPALARAVATELAADGGSTALGWLVENLRSGGADRTAERMLLLALRADPAPARPLLKALLGSQGGVAMLGAVADGLLERSQQPGSSQSAECSSQQPQGTVVLTQDLYTQPEECEDSEAEPEPETDSQEQTLGGTDIVARYESILAEERKSASMRMEAMQSAAAAEQQSLQGELEAAQRQLKAQSTKHEARVEKLTEVAKRERYAHAQHVSAASPGLNACWVAGRERRVASEGACRRETDEAAAARRQLAIVQEELGDAKRAGEEGQAELAALQSASDKAAQQASAELAEARQEARQEAETQAAELQRLETERESARLDREKSNAEIARLEAKLEEEVASREEERQSLHHKLVVVTEGYTELEAEAETLARQTDEAEAAHVAALAACDERRAAAEDARASAEAELRKLNKSMSLMSALIGTTQTQPTDEADDSPPARHEPRRRAKTKVGDLQAHNGDEPDPGSLETVLKLSQSDETPHRDVKAHLRQVYDADADAEVGAAAAPGLVRLPTWSQACVDEPSDSGTVFYGSMESPPPDETPRAAFEWEPEQDKASRDRRLAFLAASQNPAGGGSVRMLREPEEEDDDKENQQSAEKKVKRRSKLKLLRAQEGSTQRPEDGSEQDSCSSPEIW